MRASLRDPWVWGQLLLFLLVLAGVPLLVKWADADGRLGWLAGRDGGSRWFALVPLVVGLAVALLGAWNLGANLTPATTPRKRGQLVRAGLYARVRHPIYAGLILTLWALAWWLGNWRLGLVSLLVSYAYFDRKAAAEERRLRERFPGYAEYQARVPKLFPWPGAGASGSGGQL
jgi:protein-S-isoprenylcysteine O-methyltransferase Ste14